MKLETTRLRAASGTRRGASKTGAARQAAKATSTGAAGGPRGIKNRLDELKLRLREISDLGGAGAVLGWDQATFMPRGGADARGRQLATLSRLQHERLVDPVVGRLIDQLETALDGRDEADDDLALVRVARRDFERAICVPPALVEEISALGNKSYLAWTRARPANDFESMVPLIEDSVRLSRAFSACFKSQDHLLDPLISGSDPGLTTATVTALFDDLGAALGPLVVRARSNAPVDDTCLRTHLAEAKQLAFARRIAEKVGYDLARGRIDVSPHPFSTRFGHGDVRITTRVSENMFCEALYATLHEAGHAMYEQGVDQRYDGTPLAGGASSGVHESQSRLWENIVGRGEDFLAFLYPLIQKEVPALKRVPMTTFERAINRVAPSLIRTDADELTYTLHVIIRFELERQLLEGTLAARNLPDAWAAAYDAALGVVPHAHAEGCLQDVHWYSGLIGGAFQGYAVGNILAAQFFAAAVEARPEISAGIRDGRFGPLHSWLGDNIHRHGRKYLPADLVVRATGSPMMIAPYVSYLTQKYEKLGVI